MKVVHGNMSNRLRSLLAGVMVSVGLVAGCVVPVACAVDVLDAFTVEGARWNLDGAVRGAWAQGVDGKGVKVAVVDTAVMRGHPSLEGQDISYRLVLPEGYSECTASHKWGLDEDVVLRVDDPRDTLGRSGAFSTHGTDMVATIAGNGKGFDGQPGIQGVAPGASVTSYAKGVNHYLFGIKPEGIPCEVSGEHVKAVDLRDTVAAAIEDGARVINFSGEDNGGFSIEPYLEALRRGVVVVTGRPNDLDPGADDMVGAPWYLDSFPGFVRVNAVDSQGRVASFSDVKDGNVGLLSPGVGITGYAPEGKALIPRDGTSIAAASLSGYVALAMQRWPEATGNQIMQSLVRNAKGNSWGQGRLDPEHKRGFGQVDPARLLSVDPSQYPDVNPFLEAAVLNSDRHPQTEGMYTADRDIWGDFEETDPFPTPIRVQREASLVADEYHRQKEAWQRVEQCRADGGEDCMRYSATATAGQVQADKGKTADTDSQGSEESSSGSSSSTGQVSGLPWGWFAGALGVLVVVLVCGGVAFFKRRK